MPMDPLIGYLTPVKAAMGTWLGEFFAGFRPDTPANAEWGARSRVQAMAWAPGRMVDAADQMLSSWKTNDNTATGQAGQSAFLPVLFAAIANEYTESPAEAGRHLTDDLPFSFPGDIQNRSFTVSLLSIDVRAQIVVAANDPATAMSMLAQLSKFAMQRQRFTAGYTFRGFTTQWPVTIVQTDRLAVPSPVGDNIVMLALDLVLRASIPQFDGPAEGFPVVQAVDAAHNPDMPKPDDIPLAEWQTWKAWVSAGAPKVVLAAMVEAEQ